MKFTGEEVMDSKAIQDAESTAIRVGVSAVITGICGWFANYLRKQRALSKVVTDVAEMKQVIAPESNPDCNLSTRMDSQDEKIQAVNDRVDDLYKLSTDNHSEVCKMLVQISQNRPTSSVFGSQNTR